MKASSTTSQVSKDSDKLEFNQTVPVLSTIAILALTGQSCRLDGDGQAGAVIWGHG